MDSVWGKPNSSPVRDVLSLVQPSLVKFIIIIIIIIVIIIIIIKHINNWSNNTTHLKVIDQWERPVEVAKWLDLLPSVQQDHTAQNNPPSLSLSRDVDDAPPSPLNPGTSCHSPWRRCKKVAAPQASCG